MHIISAFLFYSRYLPDAYSPLLIQASPAMQVLRRRGTPLYVRTVFLRRKGIGIVPPADAGKLPCHSRG